MEILVRFVKSLFVFLFSLICLVSCNFDEIFFFGDGDIDDRTSLVTSYILYDENPQVNPKAKFVTADFEFGSLLNPDAIFSNYYLRPGYTATGWMLVDDSYHDMSEIELNDDKTVKSIVVSPFPVKLYATGWTANTNTPYTVKYYGEDTSGNYTVEIYSEVKRGTTDTLTGLTCSDLKNISGYDSSTATIENVYISGWGTSVVNVYCERKTVTLTIESEAGTFYYYNDWESRTSVELTGKYKDYVSGFPSLIKEKYFVSCYVNKATGAIVDNPHLFPPENSTYVAVWESDSNLREYTTRHWVYDFSLQEVSVSSEIIGVFENKLYGNKSYWTYERVIKTEKNKSYIGGLVPDFTPLTEADFASKGLVYDDYTLIVSQPSSWDPPARYNSEYFDVIWERNRVSVRFDFNQEDSSGYYDIYLPVNFKGIPLPQAGEIKSYSGMYLTEVSSLGKLVGWKDSTGKEYGLGEKIDIGTEHIVLTAIRVSSGLDVSLSNSDHDLTPSHSGQTFSVSLASGKTEKSCKWFMDGTQISGQSALSFVLDNSKYSVGYHSLMIEVTDTDNNVYTATWEVGITN